MKDRIFLDTNLLVYLYSDHKNGRTVEKIIEGNFGSIVLSAQIIGELYNVLTRKKIKNCEEAFQIISEIISSFMITETDALATVKAIELNIKYGYSYWDSLVIASALLSDCSTLYSEDMQSGQVIENHLKIINPFK